MPTTQKAIMHTCIYDGGKKTRFHEIKPKVHQEQQRAE